MIRCLNSHLPEPEDSLKLSVLRNLMQKADGKGIITSTVSTNPRSSFPGDFLTSFLRDAEFNS